MSIYINFKKFEDPRRYFILLCRERSGHWMFVNKSNTYPAMVICISHKQSSIVVSLFRGSPPQGMSTLLPPFSRAKFRNSHAHAPFTVLIQDPGSITLCNFVTKLWHSWVQYKSLSYITLHVSFKSPSRERIPWPSFCYWLVKSRSLDIKW